MIKYNKKRNVQISDNKMQLSRQNLLKNDLYTIQEDRRNFSNHEKRSRNAWGCVTLIILLLKLKKIINKSFE